MRILVAEDDQDASEMYRITLKSRGPKVEITDDGKECLEIYRGSVTGVKNHNSVPFDVVILDFQLPCLDGLYIARAILKSRPNQRIVIASAYVKTMPGEKIEGMQGFIELLPKPFEPRELVRIVENVPNLTDADKMRSIIALTEISSRSISEEGIAKGIEILGKVLGPKVTPALLEEFRHRGLISTPGKPHTGEELLSVLEELFGPSNKAFFVRFFLEFFD
jgi:DNA-binding response OmpR family regulator